MRKNNAKAKKVNENYIRELMKLSEFYRLEFTVSFSTRPQDRKIILVSGSGYMWVGVCEVWDDIESGRFCLFAEEQKGH